MENEFGVELVGYLAMVILIISFLPKEVKWIRLINFVGCIVFVIYGILLGWKYPLIISNGIIAVIQLYYLFKSAKSK